MRFPLPDEGKQTFAQGLDIFYGLSIDSADTLHAGLFIPARDIVRKNPRKNHDPIIPLCVIIPGNIKDVCKFNSARSPVRSKGLIHIWKRKFQKNKTALYKIRRGCVENTDDALGTPVVHPEFHLELHPP